MDKIPIDKDTTVETSKKTTFMNSNAILEQWSWDGVCGKSLIVECGELRGMDDESLLRIARQYLELSKEDLMTIKRTDEFVFINFDFETF